MYSATLPSGSRTLISRSFMSLLIFMVAQTHPMSRFRVIMQHWKKPWIILSKLNMWYWINPHNHRYYLADMVQDLLGDWTLVCAWGGHGTLRGDHSISGVASYADGLRKIDALGAHREKRGYIGVSSFAGWTSQIVAMEKGVCSPPDKLVQGSDIQETAFVLE